MEKYTDKICSKCGKPYHGLFNSLYCSKECKNDALLGRLREKHKPFVKQKVCAVCGKPFVANSNSQKTCSEECRNVHYNNLWKKSYEKRMKDSGKKERHDNARKKWYSDNKDRLQKTQHERIIDKKRALAQEMQTEEPVVNNNGNIKQAFTESLGIRRLSERGCECLRCGKSFNLKCAERGAIGVLYRLALSGKSPCPFCGEAPTGVGNNRSCVQMEIRSLYPNFTEINYRPEWMDGLEIDLFDPVAKVGLEFHGTKWHSTVSMSDKDASTKHKKKADLCDANGVQLIQLYETEWVQKRAIVIDKLNAIFHKDMTRLFARKLKVRLLNDSVNRKEATKFLDKNHIQGSAGAQWSVGLVDGMELVAVCTFKYGTGYSCGGQSKGTGMYWELNRYATKLGYCVVGGLSKCIDRFFKEHPEVHKIVSFADRRWTSPLRTAYGSSGFVYKGTIEPNYKYTDLDSRHPLKNKQYMRKSQIEKRGEACYSPEKTETEMSKELGFYRIYDAGKIRYEMER